MKKNNRLSRSSEIHPQYEVFDNIAQGWYNFRHYSIFPRELKELANRWHKGSLLNVGSGHGADFLPFNKDFDLYGVDFSSEMIKMAGRYSHKFGLAANWHIADARFLPFLDESFDWAIAIAVYHHLKGRDEQLRALLELRRVLKPGAEAFLTVWNRCQRRFWFKNKELDIPWKSRGEIFYRYYYLFTFGEIERLVKQSGFRILKSFPEYSYHLPVKYFSKNICLLVKK